MNVRTIIEDAHSQNILCIAWDAYGRRLFTGSEDQTVKVWELDTGKHMRTGMKHEGQVTSLAYATKSRILFSASVDGLIVGWNTAMKPVCEHNVHSPVTCLAWDPVNRVLVSGSKQHLNLYHLKKRVTTDLLEMFKMIDLQEDFVKCLFCNEGKIYVGSYDKYLRIYDAMDGRLITCTKVHSAGLNVLTANDVSGTIVTGSQDKRVKMWNFDGGQAVELGPFPNKITGLAVNMKTKTLWVSCNSPSPIVVDARTGSNVTSYMSELIPPINGSTAINQQTNLPTTASAPPGSNHPVQSHAAPSHTHPPTHAATSGYGINSETTRNFLLMGHIKETDEVVATTSLREVVIWKHNPSKPITTLYGHSQSVECLTYSQRTLQFFSGGGDATIRKWVLNVKEQNSFIYNYDVLQGHAKAVLACVHYEPLDILITASVDKSICLWSFTELPKAYAEDGIYRSVARVPSAVLLQNRVGQKEQYLQQVKQRFKEKQQQHAQEQQELDNQDKEETPSANSLSNTIAAILHETKAKAKQQNKRNSKNIDFDSTGMGSTFFDSDISIDEEMLASSVGGMSYQYVLNEHSRRVTALTCATKGQSHYLISVSWDLSICFWDINSDTKNFLYKIENAHQDYITDVDYSPSLSRFATSSVDNQLHLWDFDSRKLLNVMSGHTAEVSTVKWCSEGRHGPCWMSGSDDRTVRLWNGDGVPLCVIKCEGIVTALCPDKQFGHAVVATDDHVIRVYDVVEGYVLESHRGHEDTINAIVHIPDVKHYISAGWDRSIRIWNACQIEHPSHEPTPSLPVPPKTRTTSESSFFDLPVQREKEREREKEKEREMQKLREVDSSPTFAEMHPLVLPKIMRKDKISFARVDEYSKPGNTSVTYQIDVAPPMSSAGQKLAKKFADLEATMKEKQQRSTPKPTEKKLTFVNK